MISVAPSRKGFTLMELLVVVAVLGLLIALLLPATQAARESARRASCQSNLKQIVLATLHHQAIHDEFPIGSRGQRTPSDALPSAGVSWWLDAMPWLERRDIYDRFDRKGRDIGQATVHLANGSLVDRVIVESMKCPSSSLPSLWPVGDFQLMMPSYVGIAGATSHEGFLERRVSICCSPKADGEISAGGMLVNNRAIRVKDVRDGLSNTLVVGEASDFVYDSRSVAQRIDGAFYYGWMMGTKATGTPTEPGGPAIPPSWNITSIRYGINFRDYDAPGVYNIKGANNPLVSSHQGGINAAIADGAVRFLADGMAVSTLKRLATRDDGDPDENF